MNHPDDPIQDREYVEPLDVDYNPEIEQRQQDEIDKRDYLADMFKMENGIYE